MLRVATAELRELPAEERDERLSKLVAAARAPRNGQANVLADRIRALEVQYGMRSNAMLAKLAEGQMPDTADLSRWLILLRARDGR